MLLVGLLLLAGTLANSVKACQTGLLTSWQPPGNYQDGILPMPQAEGDWIPPQDIYGPDGYGTGFENFNGPNAYGDEVFEPEPVESWFSWMSWEQWDSSFEAGINGSDGNSDTLSLVTGFDLVRTTEFHESTIDFRYNTTHTNQVETQNNALLQFGHEWLLPGSPWSAFVNNDLLYDRFKAFDLRLVINGGVGYTHIKTDVTTFKTRYGAGISREFGGPDDSWVPEALLGMDYKRQLTERQKLNLTVDYFPEFGSFDDFRLVTDFSWELLVDEEANLSLKVNVNDQYDSTPNGARPNDIFYSLLLLWKL